MSPQSSGDKKRGQGTGLETEWNSPHAPPFTRQQGKFDQMTRAMNSLSGTCTIQQPLAAITSPLEKHPFFHHHTFCKDNVSGGIPRKEDAIHEPNGSNSCRRDIDPTRASQWTGIPQDSKNNKRIQSALTVFTQWQNELPAVIAGLAITVGLVLVSGLIGTAGWKFRFWQITPTRKFQEGQRTGKMVKVNEERHNARGRWKTTNSMQMPCLMLYFLLSPTLNIPSVTQAKEWQSNNQQSNTQGHEDEGYDLGKYQDNLHKQEQSMSFHSKGKTKGGQTQLNKNEGPASEKMDNDVTQGPMLCRLGESTNNGTDIVDRLSDEPELEELRRMVANAQESERQAQRQLAQRYTLMERNEEIWLEIRALAVHEFGRRSGVKMYGLKNIHQDTRTRVARMNDIRDRVGFLVWLRQQWLDLIHFEDMIHAHYVSPQPTPYICGSTC